MARKKTLKKLPLLTWAATINATILLYKFKMKNLENRIFICFVIVIIAIFLTR